MPTQMEYFTGKIKWPKLHQPDEKYNKYTVSFYLDDESLARFDALGLSLKKNTDEDGVFVRFARPAEKEFNGVVRNMGKPAVFNSEGEAYDGQIGNGSSAIAKVEVYDSRAGKAHRLHSIKITDLVEYVGVDTRNPEDVPF